MYARKPFSVAKRPELCYRKDWSTGHMEEGMRASDAEVNRWVTEATQRGATHLLVVCDTFDGDEYPVSVSKGEDIRDALTRYHDANMQKVVVVYDLAAPSPRAAGGPSGWYDAEGRFHPGSPM